MPLIWDAIAPIHEEPQPWPDSGKRNREYPARRLDYYTGVCCRNPVGRMGRHTHKSGRINMLGRHCSPSTPRRGGLSRLAAL